MDLKHEALLLTPCCTKKGTLVITIEPCEGGNLSKTGLAPKHAGGLSAIFQSDTQISRGSKDIPLAKIGEDGKHDGIFPLRLPMKREKARTIEVELKIIGQGGKLFSDESLKSDTLEKSDVPSLAKEESVVAVEELEVEAAQPKAKVCKICEQAHPGTVCPGKDICHRKKPVHYLGDGCKLSNPDDIGRSILKLHKNGLITKIRYPTDPHIYPDFLRKALAEIQKMELERHEHKPLKAKSASGVIMPEIESRESSVLSIVPDASMPLIPFPSSSSTSSLTVESEVIQKMSGCLCK